MGDPHTENCMKPKHETATHKKSANSVSKMRKCKNITVIKYG